MRLRPALLFLAALAVLSLVLGGCTGTGETAQDGASDEGTTQDGLEVGVTAPDFRLKNQDQTTVALSDYKGSKNVILVFYPADFTPV